MPHNPARLKVVDRAFQLAVSVHRVADRFAREIAATSPGMRSQMLRAVDSIAYNIAEATSHDSPTRMAAQLMVAVGSCNELEIQLKLGDALGVLGESGPSLITETQEIRMMLFGLRKRVLQPPAA
ncbi:MAG TPA: four helix bundle protein [Gemmatimonas sp.]|uniref:four helix bundle protein n=1 Tax=Gemmatimonas sp. TaxID=1962908 RepID=UPI002ED79193